MKPVQCWPFSGPLPQLCYLRELRNPSNSPETFPEACFPWPCGGRQCAQQGGKQDGVEEVRGSRPLSNLSLPLVGAGNKEAALPPTPPRSSRPLSRVVTGGSAHSGQTRGFLPSRQCLHSWRKQALGSRLSTPTTTGCPAGRAGLQPERPPHSTPPLAKHVFLFSDGEEGAGTHPEQTRELISPRGLAARLPAASAEAGTGLSPPWRSLRPECQVQS